MTTVCTVSGTLKNLQGETLADTAVGFSRAGVASQYGDAIIPFDVQVVSGGSGAVSFDIYPGNYVGVASPVSGRVEKFTMSVPEATTADIADLIGGPGVDITTGLTELAEDLSDETAARIAGDHANSTGTQYGGVWNPSTGAFPIELSTGGPVSSGDFFDIEETGIIDGVVFKRGLTIRALVDSASATDSSDWYQPPAHGEPPSDMDFFDYEYIEESEVQRIRRSDRAGQNANVVTSGIQSMMDAAMSFVKSGTDKVARIHCRGGYAVNDELFSEEFASELWDLTTAVGGASFVFEGPALFYATSWPAATRSRSSGFYRDQSITNPVPTVMFRWEQRIKLGISPKINGWEMHGEFDIDTDPIGFKFRNINVFDMVLKAEGCAQGGLHISDMNNGSGGHGIRGEVSRCGATITGSGGSGFLPAGVRADVAPGAGFTTVSLRDIGGGTYTGNFAFTGDHVGKEVSVSGVGVGGEPFTAKVQSVTNTTTVVLDQQATSTATESILTFTYLPVATVAGSPNVTVMPNMTTDLTGRYVGVVGADSTLQLEIGTPFVRVISHDLTTGDLVLARNLGRTMADTALFTGPEVFIGKDEDQVQADGVSPESGHNNDVRVSLRIESGFLGYPAINMFAQFILATQFIGAKWHGLPPTGENYGANWCAMILDSCKSMQAIGTQIEWGGHSADYGKVVVTGARTHVSFDTTHMGDFIMSDSCALVYTDPQASGRENCRVTFGGGSFLNAESFPRTNQSIHRNGEFGRAEHVQGLIFRRNGGPISLTSVTGRTEIVSDTPTLVMSDVNNNTASRLFTNGAEFKIEIDDTGNGVFDKNVLRYTAVDGLQVDQGDGWQTAFQKGDFAPTINIGGDELSTIGGVYSSQAGTFQIVAGVCWVKIAITLSAKNTSGTGLVSINIPSEIRPANYNDTVNAGFYTGFAGINANPFGATQGDARDEINIRFPGLAGGGHVSMTDANLTDTSRIEMSGSFKI